MPERKSPVRKLSASNTKQDMLNAYNELAKQLQEMRETEMASRKEELSREIQVLRAEWEKEKKQHETENKERDQVELKKREREKEEYRYVFAREQQVAKDQFEDDKAKLERDIQYKKEQMEKELAEREKAVAQKRGRTEPVARPGRGVSQRYGNGCQQSGERGGRKSQARSGEQRRVA